MSAVFLKEIRENLKWALLICGVFAVFVYNEIRGGRPFMLYHLPESATIFLAPLAGLLMGVAQSWFETRPDNWAFVVHRPISRLATFIAKSAAGLLLLYGALVVPWCLAVSWAAKPGNLPTPFQWQAVYPTLTDVLNAGTYYFAGTILVLRKARWFGSRLLPLGLPVASSVALFMLVPDASWAIAIIVAVSAIEAAAAWNVFSTAGGAELGGLPSLGLGIMFYAGAVLVGLAAGALPIPFYSSNEWQQYFLDRDGNPLQVVWSRTNDSDRTSTITDPTGKVVADYDGVDIDDPANAERFVRFNRVLLDERTVRWPGTVFFLERGYRRPTDIVGLRAVAPQGTRLRFQCLFNVERGIIELYDPVTRLLEGTVGPDGFGAAAAEPTTTFPGRPLNSWQQASNHALSFPSIVYWLELNQRRVRPVFTATADDPIVATVELPPEKDPKLVILTRARLHLMRPTGEEIFSAPFDLDRSQHFFQAAILPGNGHLVLHVGFLPWVGKVEMQYVEFDDAGKIVRTTDLAERPSPAGVKGPQTALFGGIFPLAAVPLVPPWAIDWILDLRAGQFSTMFFGCMLAGGVTSAIATVLVGRRCGYGVGKTIAWAVTNLLFGFPGLVVMLSLNEWPAREVCATCGKQRLVGRREGTCCGALLPPPSADGREIFEPAESFQITG